jgi:hypothetical protein
LLPFRELGKTNKFMISLFSTIITKEFLKRNVALNSFVGKIATIVKKGKMGAVECTTLALEEECNFYCFICITSCGILQSM